MSPTLAPLVPTSRSLFLAIAPNLPHGSAVGVSTWVGVRRLFPPFLILTYVEASTSAARLVVRACEWSKIAQALGRPRNTAHEAHRQASASVGQVGGRVTLLGGRSWWACGDLRTARRR